MRVTCPNCSGIFSLEAALNDENARHFSHAAQGIAAKIGSPVTDYIALFRRPNTGTVLQWRKARRLAEELKVCTDKSYIQIDNQIARPVTGAIWRQAIEKIMDRKHKLKLPMKNHNYLFEIVYELAEEASKKSEIKQNKRIASGTANPDRPVSDVEKLSVSVSVSAEEMKESRQTPKAKAARTYSAPLSQEEMEKKAADMKKELEKYQ
ncbi:MAG: hypothetical protein GY749_08035 [Desulfobacteraceae bacterium]|nr:hypothetical protein [Desulfobacteraceae bacterium]